MEENNQNIIVKEKSSIKNSLEAFVFSFLGFIVGGVLVYFAISHNWLDLGAPNNNLETKNIKKVIVNDKGIGTAVERTYNSVVMIKVYKNNKYLTSGSGFVYKVKDNDAYILTNHHVAKAGDSVEVVYSNGTTTRGEIMGTDKFLDIAVIKVLKKTVLGVAPLGDYSKVKVGDSIFVIGTPVGGEYYNSVTSGIISGLKRKVQVSVEAPDDWIMQAIQIDAAINPGNSGGPVLNSAGEVIGIVSMKLVNNTIEGMGFAIIINDAARHLETLETGKSVERPYLGIAYMDVSSPQLGSYGVEVPRNVTQGVAIIGVQNGTGAKKAGLKKNDVIIEIGGEKVENQAYLRYQLYKYNAGDKIKVKYNRGGIVKETTIDLGKNNTK